MDSAKVCRFLATSFLLLLLLGNPTAACSCLPLHPQNAYCFSDIVAKGKFVGVTENETDVYLGWKRYEIITTKVYKAPGGMQDIHFLYSDAICMYDHFGPLNGEEEYLITGRLDVDNRVSISTCTFIKPWAKLTPVQKQGLSSDYSAGCSCNVNRCNSYHSCTALSDNDCPWTDLEGPQVQDMACLPTNKSPSTCSWQTLSS